MFSSLRCVHTTSIWDCMYKKLYEIHSESLSLDPSIHWHTWLVHITYTINMAYFKGLFDLFICFCVSKFRLYCSETDNLAIHHTYCMHNVSHCLPVSFCNFWMLFAFQQKAWMSKSIVYWCMTMYSVIIDSENATGSSQYWTGMMKVNTQQSLKTVTVRLCWKKICMYMYRYSGTSLLRTSKLRTPL